MSSLVRPSPEATVVTGVREITMAQALLDATRLEMQRDERVFVMGQGVDDARGMFGTTLDLHTRFGPERSFDVPLAEEGMTGVGIGAALSGMRPIQVHQRMDFLLLCMNQLVNMAAKVQYMFNGAHRVPLVVRAIIGRSWGQGAQHSQAFHSYFMHTPGLKVVAPTTPYDAKGCLAAAIRDDNPVIMVEHRLLHPVPGLVPDHAYTTPFGRARTLTAGHDITIVGISHMALECVRAMHLLATRGVHAEVIDPVSLSPLDIPAIAESAARTRHLLVVDTGWLSCGAAGEIVLRVLEELGSGVAVEFARMGYLPTPCPTTRSLETLFYPSATGIADRAYAMVTGDVAAPWDAGVLAATEITEFKGPF
ncbi:MAG TPA: transketolase C-terminal domain-containing protein [Euzebyales bacterium]|nr:transketolase C-terminal domain-containing protein [Euzebyales bacterium]